MMLRSHSPSIASRTDLPGPHIARLRVLLCGAMLVAAAALPHAAHAQTPSEEPPYGFSGSVGLNAVNLPTYEGSPNRRTLAGPDLTLSYRTRDWGTLELGQRGLAWQALEVGAFRFSLLAGADPGRKTRDPKAFDPTPGDKRLAGMGNIRASAEAGFGLGFGPLNLIARQSLGDRGHDGAQAELSVGVPIPVTQSLNLRAGAGVTWADADYMQTYFGVTPAQAAATRFRAYTPSGGLRKAELSLGAEYSLSAQWKLQANIAATKLYGDAARSPLVARESSVSASLGVVYGF
jgi:MipA family protein